MEQTTEHTTERRSTRESRPPEKYQYFKLGGDPMVTDDPVGEIEADVLTNASSVQPVIECEEGNEQGWVSWIQEKSEDWIVSLV